MREVAIGESGLLQEKVSNYKGRQAIIREGQLL